VNRHQQEAEEKIVLLNDILAGERAKEAMVGFIAKFGSGWHRNDLTEILETDRSEKFCETPTLKAFYVFERLREICIAIIMEIYEQPE
jgi:hypothetical protein